MKFVLAKVVKKPMVETPIIEKKANVANSKAKGKSLPKNQKGSQVQTRPNYFRLHALKRADLQRAQENERGMPRGKQAKEDNDGQLIGDAMEMLNNIASCLANFTPRFEHYVARTPSSKDLTQNTRVVWMKKGTHA